MTATLALNPMQIRQWPDLAISKEAEDLSQLLSDVRDGSPSVTWSKRHWDLDTACAEAATPDWDGQGAKPVLEQTYRLASRFLAILPRNVPHPDVSIDPDGEVSMTWRRATKQFFSVSVGPNGRLSFAGIFGESNFHGTEYFLDEIPATVKAALIRVFS